MRELSAFAIAFVVALGIALVFRRLARQKRAEAREATRIDIL